MLLGLDGARLARICLKAMRDIGKILSRGPSTRCARSGHSTRPRSDGELLIYRAGIQARKGEKFDDWLISQSTPEERQKYFERAKGILDQMTELANQHPGQLPIYWPAEARQKYEELQKQMAQLKGFR